jgi:hypothetical protein
MIAALRLQQVAALHLQHGLPPTGGRLLSQLSHSPTVLRVLSFDYVYLKGGERGWYGRSMLRPYTGGTTGGYYCTGALLHCPSRCYTRDGICWGQASLQAGLP